MNANVAFGVAMGMIFGSIFLSIIVSGIAAQPGGFFHAWSRRRRLVRKRY